MARHFKDEDVKLKASEDGRHSIQVVDGQSWLVEIPYADRGSVWPGVVSVSMVVPNQITIAKLWQ